MSSRDLIDFYRARLDEEEAQIRDAILSWEPNVSEADLADVEAKRKLLAAYTAIDKRTDAVPPDAYDMGRLDALEDAVRILAEPYASHPDYREWYRPA